MTDYITREDGLGKFMYATREHPVPPLKYILETEYPYIYESLTEERPFVIYDNVIPSLFKEIIYDNKVVGFSSYLNGADTMFIMEFVYVLPEYRGNNLLIEDLKDTVKTFGDYGYKYVAIDFPNLHVIDSLVKYGYAQEFNDHLVVSTIPFTCRMKDGDELSSDEKTFLTEASKRDGSEILGVNAFTNVYDKDICACVFLDVETVTGMCDEDMRIRPNLLYDRMSKGEDYFSNIKNELLELIEEFDG